MNEADMLFSVTVPGSTANLGPGFDSVGMALSRYLKLTVFESDKWSFEAETETVAGINSSSFNFLTSSCIGTISRSSNPSSFTSIRFNQHSKNLTGHRQFFEQCANYQLFLQFIQGTGEPACNPSCSIMRNDPHPVS
nr:ThrB [Cloning vector pCgeA-C-thr]AHG54643.1 ThrB [Cloning vector pCgeA-CL-thr]AHG54650.1 ThrB [Cloning vector pCotZ-C-thr]AHG54658.1 ThrB [Cloning vector pCotZ-CL-thr]